MGEWMCTRAWGVLAHKSVETFARVGACAHGKCVWILRVVDSGRRYDTRVASVGACDVVWSSFLYGLNCL